MERLRQRLGRRKQPYDILGLDPITVSEMDVLKQKVDTGDEEHAYGLDHKLFMPSSTRKDIFRKFNETRERWDKVYDVQQAELQRKRNLAKAMYRGDNPLMNGLGELVSALQTEQGAEPK